MDVFMNLVVDFIFRFQAVQVFCWSRRDKINNYSKMWFWIKIKSLKNQSTNRTNRQTAVLHVMSVFQVHGPHVTVKEPGRVGDGVLPCTEINNISVFQLLKTRTIHEFFGIEFLHTFSLTCTPRMGCLCNMICQRIPAKACLEGGGVQRS